MDLDQQPHFFSVPLMDLDQQANFLAVPLIWEVGKFKYIYFDNLPPYKKAIDLLWCEEALTSLWLQLAVEYKKQNLLDAYAHILEACLTRSNSNYDKGPEHIEEAKFTLAQHYYDLAAREIDSFRQSSLYHRANYLIDGEVKGFKRRHGEDVGLFSPSLGKRTRLGSH